jgi:hypothetical protein
MSIPTRPDIDKFIVLINELADKKSQLANSEYEYEKDKAHNIKRAMDDKAKTRAIDYVKVIGITEEDEKRLDGLKKHIINLNREITILYGKIEAWKAEKEIYRTDSFHQVTGRGTPFVLGEGD